MGGEREGERIDARLELAEVEVFEFHRIGEDDSQELFIVARGHPELLDQLRAVMGHESGVDIIEDRRQHSREEGSEEAAREIRKRLREGGQPEQG